MPRRDEYISEADVSKKQWLKIQVGRGDAAALKKAAAARSAREGRFVSMSSILKSLLSDYLAGAARKKG